jgi:hypothetical protein
MARRGEKRTTASEPVEAVPASPFRWPSRRRANEAELAARRAAKAGLERLRARTPRPSALPQPIEPEAVEPYEATEPYEAIEPYDPPVPEPGSEPQPAPAPPEPQAVRAPAPVPWDAELDALTEKLVADLRRDLGPASDE